jgi:hypothetical protein
MKRNQVPGNALGMLYGLGASLAAGLVISAMLAAIVLLLAGAGSAKPLSGEPATASAPRA